MSEIVGAQEPRPYVGGGLAMSSWAVENVSGGTPSTTYSNTGTDTKHIALVVEAGQFVGGSTAIGVEASLQLHRSALISEARYFSPTLRESLYREQALFLVLRHQSEAIGRARVGVVGGGGLVQGRSLERVAQGSVASSAYGPFGQQTEQTALFLGLTFGLDVALETSPTISVISQFRVVMVQRGDVRESGSSLAQRGLPGVMNRFGVGIRATF